MAGSWEVVIPSTEAVPGQAGQVFRVLALTASGSFTDDDEKQSLLTTVKISAEEPSCQAGDDTCKNKQQQSKKSKYNWVNVAVIACLWIASTLCNVAYSMIAPFFPQIAAERGASPLLIGLIIGCAPLSVVLTSPLFGYVLPYFKMWCQVLFGLLLVGVSYLSLGFATMVPTKWGFVGTCVALRLLEGVGTAILSTATFSTFPNLFPKSVGTLVGLFEIGGSMGYMVGPWLGGALYQYGGYKVPFFTIGGSILFFAIPCTLFLLLLRKMSFVYEKKTLPLRVICNVFTDLPFIVIVVIVGSLYYPSSILSPSLPQFLDNEYHQSVLEIGSLYFIGSASYVIGAIPIGLVTDRLGYKRLTCLFGMLVIVAGWLIFGVPYYFRIRNIWLIRLSTFLRYFGEAFSIIPVYGLLLAIGKKYMKPGDNMAGLSSFLSGVIAAAGSFNLVIGPLLGGITAIVPVPMTTILLAEIIMAEALLFMGISLIDKCANRD